MKKILTAAITALIFNGNISAQPGRMEPVVDASAMELFFETAEKLKTGYILNQEEWDILFETGGFNTIPGRARKSVIIEVMPLAFDPGLSGKRDSLMNIPAGQGSQTWFKQYILENFIDMTEHWEELDELRRKNDFGQVVHEAIARLDDFLPDGLSRDVPPCHFYLVCYDRDAHGGHQVTLDFNLYYHTGRKGTIDLLAHEIFHFYRYNLKPDYWEFINDNLITDILSAWQNEGIADMLDKDADELLPYLNAGLQDEQIREYIRRRDNTPEVLRELNVLTEKLMHGEISQENAEERIEEFVSFLGAHPNGRYLTRYIDQAGMREDLLRNFDSPFEFARIYNRAAEKQGGYVFSREFMEYLDSLEAQAP